MFPEKSFKGKVKMNWARVEKFIDRFILFCFCVLVIFLPIAHTETIRAFSFGIPLGLWIIKMLITRKWLFTRTPLDIPILLFTVIVAGLSLITAVDFQYSLEEYTGKWLTGVVLFYLVVNNFREEQLNYLLGSAPSGKLADGQLWNLRFLSSGGGCYLITR